MSIPGNYEYYCHHCKRLRLSIQREKPTECSQCKSTHIEVEYPGSERLTALRFGDKIPDAPISAVILRTDISSSAPNEPESAEPSKEPSNVSKKTPKP